MKLFLSSLAIDDTQAIELASLVGKEPRHIKLVLIENAADVEVAPPEWVTQNREMICSHDFEVEILDLRQYKDKSDELRKKLEEKDVIWFGGGNTFYLRWLLKDTGADKLVTEMVGEDKVYGGGSAGAVVAGPTLKHVDAADDPADAPEVIWEGLGLTESVVVPHMDNVKFRDVIFGIRDRLLEDGFKVIPLTDSQAVVIDGENIRVI